MEKVKVKAVGKYNGHSIKANKTVDLKLKFAYDELVNYIRLVQLLNENVTIKVKQSGKKSMNLGIFMVKQINVSHDGEGSLTFNSMLDYAEADKINKLANDDLFQVIFEAEIEDTDEGSEDGEEYF